MIVDKQCSLCSFQVSAITEPLSHYLILDDRRAETERSISQFKRGSGSDKKDIHTFLEKPPPNSDAKAVVKIVRLEA